MCFEIKLKMYHMVKWLNDQNTKKNQLYCSIPLHPSVLLQCIETGGIETRILSPISFLCLAKKNWKYGKTWIFTKPSLLTFQGCENDFYILVELVQFSAKEEDVMTTSISPLVEDLTRT